MQFFNLWKGKSTKPTPVIVDVHGGGWHGGTADEKMDPDLMDRGFSVVSVEYRRLPRFILPTPILDAARAIQTVRSKAVEWGLDKKRFFFRGGSAGACTVLWLGLHDDLADLQSSDTLARESTKPIGVFVTNPQTCIDPKILREWTGSDAILQHSMIVECLGYKTVDEMMKNYEKDKPLYHEYSPIFHVDKNDPPIYMKPGMEMTLPPKNTGHAIHHPIYCVKLKERLDAAGVENYLDSKDHREKKSPNAFMIEKLLNKTAPVPTSKPDAKGSSKDKTGK